MTVTHDLCEALAGDITPYCDASLVASKHDKEGVKGTNFVAHFRTSLISLGCTMVVRLYHRCSHVCMAL